jgi:hypothetical protein
VGKSLVTSIHTNAVKYFRIGIISDNFLCNLIKNEFLHCLHDINFVFNGHVLFFILTFVVANNEQLL